MSQARERSKYLYDTPRPMPRLGESTRDLVATRAAGSSGGDLFLLAANRLGYGPAFGQRAEWNALGGNQEARFTNYVDQQLDPGSIDDSEYEQRRDQANFDTIDLGLKALWLGYEVDSGGNTDSDAPQEEAEIDWFLRAIYSKRQLEQVMTEFWVDHFNVDSNQSPTESIWPHWVRTLRNHALGRFRNLLRVTSEHPAMLYYLDQYRSGEDGVAPNENYCRELFELHTLGAEHYVGIQPQSSVSPWPWSEVPGGSVGNPAGDLSGVFDHPDGIPEGYVDADIYAAARAFVGYTFNQDRSGPPFDANAGRFYFADWQSHTSSVSVLGFGLLNILNSVDQIDRAPMVLDMLAVHPGTARHICRKLCRRFVQDDPPQSLVESAADVFLSHRDSSDQIKQVLLHIIHSTEFRTSFGLKLKRPSEIVVSALRATRTHLDWRRDGDEISGWGDFLWHLENAGHRPFRWRTPDGYPDTRDKWETAAPRVMTWRMGQWLAEVEDPNDRLYMPIKDRTPNGVDRTPSALADYWIGRMLHRPLSHATREEIVDFLAQGHNHDFTIDLDDEDNERYLQMMIALIMATPEFAER